MRNNSPYMYSSDTSIHTALGASDTQRGGSVGVTCSSGDSMCSPGLTGLTGHPSVTKTSMHIYVSFPLRFQAYQQST